MALRPVRLAELLGTLSLACDMADGFPLEKVIRTVVLAVRLASRHGLAPQAAKDVFYAALLRYAGCTGFAHEAAHRYGGGDDIRTANVMSMADAADPLGTMRAVLEGVGEGSPWPRRVAAVARLLGDGEASRRHAHAQCEVSMRLASLVGVSANVVGALAHVCERFDGKVQPGRVSGEELPLIMRVVQLADVAEIAHHRDGREAADHVVKTRAGGQFDPRLCQTFSANADELYAAIEGSSVWESYLEAEPLPHALATDETFDGVALALGLFADLKSVYTLGHSPGVAHLAETAGRKLGLPAESCRRLKRAGLLHDLGRVGVPNAIWDKPGPLNPAEQDRVRLHTYWTALVLERSEALRCLSEVTAGAHERLTGDGYHRAIPASLQTQEARILAAADVYRALIEPRPHRPAHPPAEGARILVNEVDAGRLDARAAQAVLTAAGQRSAPRSKIYPRRLSEREVEVLKLVARGLSNKEIGNTLDISARTAQHHVIHIYQKCEVSSRAALALFAIENGLLDPA